MAPLRLLLLAASVAGRAAYHTVQLTRVAGGRTVAVTGSAASPNAPGRRLGGVKAAVSTEARRRVARVARSHTRRFSLFLRPLCACGQAAPGCPLALTTANVTLSGGSAGPQTFTLRLDTGRRGDRPSVLSHHLRYSSPPQLDAQRRGHNLHHRLHWAEPAL